jgi:hypothetical protein
MDYLTWAEIYFKNQDVIRKELVSIDKSALKLVLNKKRKGEVFSETVIVVGNEDFTSKVSEISSTAGKVWVVVENSKDKIKEVTKVWDKLKVKRDLSILFVDLPQNKKWAVNPAVHSMVTGDIEKSLLVLMVNA